jgi:hypothetical protein
MSLPNYFNWLKRDWAKTGLVLSIYLFIFLFVFVRQVDMVLFILLLQTPLYMLHQAEEYVFPGGFGKFFNMDIFKLATEDEPVDENFIFYVNILIIWIALPIFGLLAIQNYRWGLWIPYFSLFAGIAHIALAIKAKKLYNPGLIVSLLLNIPIGLWSILYLLEMGILNNFFLNPHIAIGLGVNAILPIMGIILLRNYKRKQASG